jgi:hypothetical protein
MLRGTQRMLIKKHYQRRERKERLEKRAREIRGRPELLTTNRSREIYKLCFVISSLILQVVYLLYFGMCNVLAMSLITCTLY